MKFTLSWLKDHLETEASLDEVVEALTMVGLEVEEVSDPSAPLKPFVVAKVVTADKHPNADKLKLLSVDAGKGPVQSTASSVTIPAAQGSPPRHSRSSWVLASSSAAGPPAVPAP